MRFLTGLFLIFLCAACSFSPLYLAETDEVVLQETAQIQIEPIDGVLGYTVRESIKCEITNQSGRTQKIHIECDNFRKHHWRFGNSKNQFCHPFPNDFNGALCFKKPRNKSSFIKRANQRFRLL